MNANPQKRILYGKPTSPTAEQYIKEYYCAVCNKIPIIDTWDRSEGKIIGAEITDLYPIDVEINGEKAITMVCYGCLNTIKNKMAAELKKRLDSLRVNIFPQGPGPDIGGGIGVRPM